LYVYVDGFSASGANFYVQDFQLVAGEFPFEVRVNDGQFLEFFRRQFGECRFKEIREDILAAFVSEQEFEGNVDFW
jgi:hypothetical protein